MKAFLGFNRFLTRQQVIEKYQIPTALLKEVFTRISPIQGAGESALFLESLVDEQLHALATEIVRPPSVAAMSSYTGCEASKSNDWASTVASGKQETVGVAQPEPLLVSEEVAAEMLGVSRRRMFSLNKEETLQCIHIGRRKLYSVDSLRTFVKRSCGRDGECK